MTEAHIRIDEGIKKGPRKPRKPAKRDAKTQRFSPIIPLDLKPADVILRYLGDERTVDIAASYSVSRPALNLWLLEHCEEQWKKAQIARAISRKEKAEDQLDSACDPLTLARAREQLRGAQWELERLFSRLFGQKQEVRMEVDHRVILDSALQDMAGQLLDRVRTVAEIPNAAVLQSDTSIQSDDDSS